MAPLGDEEPAADGDVPFPQSPAGHEEARHDVPEDIAEADDWQDSGDLHPSMARTDSGWNHTGSFRRTSPRSASMPALGDYRVLKKKTEFSGATVEGVRKTPPVMSTFSGYKTAPCFSLASRGQSSFIKSSSSPAPGTYNLPSEEKSRFKAPPKFSFGGGSRFSLGQAPTKKSPGPGAYDPHDPVLESAKKVGFGGGARSSVLAMAQANPGPGAYEFRSTIGQGRMFTARGRHPTSYVRARSLPGPGAYNPSVNMVITQSPKCGFGTSTRTDVGATARNMVMPGPGTYEMQNCKGVGIDAPKFSATSRRRLNDLNSYVTPGPGSYNSHITCFMNKDEVQLQQKSR